MAEDFKNGLSIVPLPPGNDWVTRVANSPAGHPFLPLLLPRLPHDVSAKLPESDQPPRNYIPTSLRSPKEGNSGDVPAHETVFLQDVEAFREKTSKSVKMALGYTDGTEQPVAYHLASLKIDSCSRPVIYRYIDVIKSSFALLEAIHFELFMPDRPDLRFLAVPISAISNAFEGDYFHVTEADLLSNASFAVKLGKMTYPIVWEARAPIKMIFHYPSGKTFVAYVMKKKKNKTKPKGGEMAVSPEFPSPLLLRSSLLPDLQHDTLVRVSIREASTAHLYVVEPFRSSKLRRGESAGAKEYFKRVSRVRTSSQRVGRVVTAVHALHATEAAQIEDRLGAFTRYKYSCKLWWMRRWFQLGCLMREAKAMKAGADAASDAAESRALDSAVLKFLAQDFTPSGESQIEYSLLDAVYGAQQNATYPPRIKCIRAPPGSRAITEAASMAAAAAHRKASSPFKRQLLVAVRSATVERLGAALKEMDPVKVYNMKSDEKLDPHNPAPFDFFDLMKADELEKWKSGQHPAEKKVDVHPSSQKMLPELPIDLQSNRREFERKLFPRIILSTPDMPLQEEFYPLGKVTRVIILEANLLTEAALFCLMRRFFYAEMVLIGDEHQLPPFMYDEKILGHELAGRPAFSVAIKSGRVPVTELNEVYRAPQSLVAPYNRLVYGGRLVSKVAENFLFNSPLSRIGLIPRRLPQLLLIDVDAYRERREHSFNTDINALERLLSKFPKEWKDDIMIISLYKEQMKSIRKVTGDDYTVLTVDSAQDQEKPIVIVLTTQISSEGALIHSVERCNVAISRQQKALIILGRASVLTKSQPWSTVVNGKDFTRIKANDIY